MCPKWTKCPKRTVPFGQTKRNGVKGKMEDLVESILDYVRSDYTDYAIMINGEWGVGKTHFWNNKIKKKIESMQLNGKRYNTRTVYARKITHSPT